MLFLCVFSAKKLKNKLQDISDNDNKKNDNNNNINNNIYRRTLIVHSCRDEHRLTQRAGDVMSS